MRDARGGVGSESWRTLHEAGSVAGLSDGMLLERFAGRRDDAAEVAFAALVARHGPMVRRVCRGLLDASHDAEDAFQATFLVLARKAGVIQSPDRLANWLYGTAYRASRKLRVQSARRRKHEAASVALAASGESDDSTLGDETQGVLEEVARLPEPYRTVVVLCVFEGLSQDEAARRLGYSDRTLRRHWVRARDLLRARLTRRGLAPAIVTAASALTPEPVAAALPEATVAATARAGMKFAVKGSLISAGMVSASVIRLAEGVIQAMMWTKLKAMAIAAGLLLTLGVGTSVGVGLASSSSGPADDVIVARSKETNSTSEPSPAEQYRALVKRYEDALAVYQEAAKASRSPEETAKIYERVGPFPKDHAPAFVALAERYPNDPIAVDSLLWVLKQSLSSWDVDSDPFAESVGKAMQILGRDHAGERRLGPILFSFVLNPSPRRETFLRAIAEKSPDRAVKGQAILALSESLKTKSALSAIFQKADGPDDLENLLPPSLPENFRQSFIEMKVPQKRREAEQFYAKYASRYLEELRKTDLVAVRREIAQLDERILVEFSDVPYSRIDQRPTQETLGDIARQGRKPGPKFSVDGRVKALKEAFRLAEKKANAAANAVGMNSAGMRAYITAAPRWADFGPKMWEVVELAPRSPEALDALFWILAHHMPFFDEREERALLVGKSVDVLIRQHLNWIGENLASREVAEGFNKGSSMPAPHIARLYRALYEQGRTRETRGRMGLILARHLKTEANFAESFATSGSDPTHRPEVLMWAPSYLDELQRKGSHALNLEAEAVLERVKKEYGEIKHLNGMVLSDETLATVADRELIEVRNLGVGKVAPEINGVDVEGKAMTLSEYRGKVVLLDFGGHERCSSCRMAYPRLRSIVEQFQGRPFVVLGINTGDRQEVLKDLHTRGEITWRAWWDGDNPEQAGPIMLRWNIQSYPTFIVLDHRGAIRFKDLFPQDAERFDAAIEPLVKQAEAASKP